MQTIPIDMSDIKRQRMKALEQELKDYIAGFQEKELFECPYCHYETKKKRFTANIFTSNKEKIFFCYACRRWRLIK